MNMQHPVKQQFLSGISTSLERITPETAELYLSFNTKNRTMRVLQVDKIARDIAAGRWALNGSTIVFSQSGKLLDGQHRLAAIAKAGVPVEMLVVRGAEDSAMQTIDATIPRKAHDIAHLAGYAYAKRIASAANVMLAAKCGFIDARSKSSTSEILEVISKHPALQDCARDVDPTSKVIPNSVGISWFYMAAFLSGHSQLASTALNVLISGVPAYPGDPIHVFRERLIRMTSVQKNPVRQRMEIFYTLVGAFNDFVSQKRAAICKMRTVPVRMIGVDYETI